MAGAGIFDRTHVAELLRVDGQTLRLDMAQVESLDFDIKRNVVEGEKDGHVTHTFADDIATLTLVVEVHQPGLQWGDD